MTQRMPRFVIAILLVAGQLTGCNLSEDSDIPAAESELKAAASLSKHYVEVVFDDTVDASTLQADDFRIEGPGDSLLGVNETRTRKDNDRMLLVTDTQEPVLYTLSLATGNYQEQVFRGTTATEPEPVLHTAISLSNTSVLLTFDEDMDQLTAEDISFYRIVAANDAAPREDVGDLKILGAVLGANEITVVLTTEEQEDIEYDIKVTNVEDKTGKLINPGLNTSTFFGIGPVDLTQPQVTGVVATGSTELLVSFSEPMADGCADPTNFLVTYCTVTTVPCPAGSDAELVVTDAEANEHGTQVLLTTFPMFAGVEYTVAVSGCTDIAGNDLDPAATEASAVFGGASDLADASVLPLLTGAISTGNNTVTVTFSKPMADSAIDARNYLVVQDNVNPEVGALIVTDVQFRAPPDRTSIELTTLSQNEVNYVVTAVDVRDLFGNQLEPRRGGIGEPVQPASANFAGTPPTAADLVDADGDGLSDNEEQRGYRIYIVTTSGEVIEREVTSDPLTVDTDGDGVADNDELQYGSDPRSMDTDGDTLDDNLELNTIFSSPYQVDTDGDGLEDGLEHLFFQTSVLLADSDGDKQTDAEELLEFNRDPRIGDLPAARITVGEVRLQIDERYTFTDEVGTTITQESNSTTSLARSENTSFARTDGGVDEVVGGFDIGVRGGIGETDEAKPFIQGSFEGHYQETHATSWQSESTSARESQETYENSLTKGEEFTTTSAVTREVFGASIDVDLSIENIGDVAFSISNIEVTVLQRSHIDTQRFVPVATLIANSQLITGEPLVVNLGPFDTDRGPFLFGSREVFPNLVEDLMRSPRGLIFQVANFDIVDEFGRNFTFSDQTVRDRTAGITFDFGDGGSERHLVAVHGAIDDKGYSVPAGDYVGGFDAEGASKGLPLDYVLRDILGMKKNDQTNRDGIVAGLNKTADSIAQGDDIQIVPPGTTGLSVGTIVVGAGGDGVLEAGSLVGDDIEEFVTGYETSLTCNVAASNTGEVCSGAGDCPNGACSGPERLVRVGSYRNGDFNREWVAFYTGRVPAAADFGSIVVEARQDLFLAFLQDLDGDGLYAREEFLAGSTDSRRDDFQNDTFGIDENAIVEIADGTADSKDTDKDGLGDFAEVFIGWKISADGGTLVNVFPSPRLRDSDGDNLLDPEEADLRGFCVANDYRQDSLCSFQGQPVTMAEAIGIIAGPDGVANTTAIGDDEQIFPPGTPGLAYGTGVVGPGGNGSVETPLGGDDVYESKNTVPPATDPSRSDTDGDLVSDNDELRGYDVGLAIIDGNNGIADSLRNGDDIQKVLVDNPVDAGVVIILPGPNGVLDTPASNDDVVRAAVNVVTDPLRRDSDADQVDDGRELELGANPSFAGDGASFFDGDFDGLTDAEEASGWTVFVNGLNPITVKPSPSLPDTDFDGLPDIVERDLRSNPNRVDTDGDGLSDFDEVADFERYLTFTAPFPGVVINGSGSQRYGTSPIDTDTDNDTLSDDFELLTGYAVLVPGESAARIVKPNPLEADSDFDGASDSAERNRAEPIDALDADTDDDGRLDGAELSANTDPLVRDARITVRVASLIFAGGPNDGGNNKPDWAWRINVRKPADVFPGPQIADTVSFHNDNPNFGTFNSCPFLAFGNLSNLYFNSSDSAAFSLREGQVFAVSGELVEIDACSATSRTLGCKMTFENYFSFDDFLSGDLLPKSIPLMDSNCTATLTYEIFVD